MTIEIKAVLAGLLLLNILVYITHDSVEYQMQTMQGLPGWGVLVGSFFIVVLVMAWLWRPPMEAHVDGDD